MLIPSTKKLVVLKLVDLKKEMNSEEDFYLGVKEEDGADENFSQDEKMIQWGIQTTDIQKTEPFEKWTLRCPLFK